jgi:hypothetical protein
MGFLSDSLVWSAEGKLIISPTVGLGFAALWFSVSVVGVRLFKGELLGPAVLVFILGI